MSITRTLIVALALAALAAPASQTAPIDMHAPVVQTQEPRSGDARDAAQRDMHASVALSAAEAAPKQDLRAPADRPSVTDGGGGDWTTIGLVTGGLLLLSGLAAFTGRRIRHAQQIRATA